METLFTEVRIWSIYNEHMSPPPGKVLAEVKIHKQSTMECKLQSQTWLRASKTANHSHGTTTPVKFSRCISEWKEGRWYFVPVPTRIRLVFESYLWIICFVRGSRDLVKVYLQRHFWLKQSIWCDDHVGNYQNMTTFMALFTLPLHILHILLRFKTSSKWILNSYWHKYVCQE